MRQNACRWTVRGLRATLVTALLMTLAIGSAACGAQDTARTDSPGSAASTLASLSAEDATAVAEYLERLLGSDEATCTITASGEEGSATIPAAQWVHARLEVPHATFESSPTVDQAAFVLFDVLQRAAPPGANLDVRITALAPATGDPDEKRLKSRDYAWTPYSEYPYDVPERRDVWIDVYRSEESTDPHAIVCG